MEKYSLVLDHILISIVQSVVCELVLWSCKDSDSVVNSES